MVGIRLFAEWVHSFWFYCVTRRMITTDRHISPARSNKSNKSTLTELERSRQQQKKFANNAAAAASRTSSTEIKYTESSWNIKREKGRLCVLVSNSLSGLKKLPPTASAAERVSGPCRSTYLRTRMISRLLSLYNFTWPSYVDDREGEERRVFFLHLL